MKITTLIAAVAAGFSCALVAQTERDLESHEHGHALLNVAIDSELLFIELDTPWNNLVGFEHKPNNSEQQTLVDNTLAQLNNPGELFEFQGTKCTVVDTLVENSASDNTDDHHDEEHAEDKHSDDEHHDEGHEGDEHADEAAHDEHDEDKHGEDEHHDDEHSESDHKDHDDEGETHSSVRVSYSFECDNIAKLSTINVTLFDLWTGFEELDAQLIGPTGQAANELTPNAASLDISQIQ